MLKVLQCNSGSQGPVTESMVCTGQDVHKACQKGLSSVCCQEERQGVQPNNAGLNVLTYCPSVSTHPSLFVELLWVFTRSILQHRHIHTDIYPAPADHANHLNTLNHVLRNSVTKAQ